MKRAALALALLGLASSGCFVKRGRGIEDVRSQVQGRSNVPVHWDQGTAEDAKVRERVAALLAREISAESAVEIALLNNRSMQAVYEELGIAQADLVEAGLLDNPVLAGGARFAVGGGETLPSFSVAHEFLSLLMLPSRKKLAKAEWEQRKLRISHEVLELAAETKAAWFEAKTAELATAMQREVFEAARAGADLAIRQHAAGNISDLQLALEEEAAEQSKLDLSEAEERAFAAREGLNRHLGVWGAQTGWTLVAELPSIPAREPALEHLESVAISQRLDLEGNRQGAAIVARALGTTRAWRFVPGLEVGIEIEKEDDGQYHSGPHVALTLPLFNWGQTRVARLEAQARQAENELVARAIEIRSEVRENRDRLIRARTRVHHYRDTLLPMRQRIVRLSQLRYNAMLLGVYDLLRAKQSEIEAQRSYVEANRDYWVARIDLERTIGGSLELHTAKEGDAR